VTRYVLDTNAVSALIRGDEAVIARLSEVSRPEVSIPPAVVAEIAYGLHRMPRSKRRERLEEVWRTIAAEIARTPWTDEVSDAFGQIKSALERRGERLDDFDVAIAAHALAHDAVLVTANRKHMPG
jgi:tRNA(fMet)-specific endonuclease VapC